MARNWKMKPFSLGEKLLLKLLLNLRLTKVIQYLQHFPILSFKGFKNQLRNGTNDFRENELKGFLNDLISTTFKGLPKDLFVITRHLIKGKTAR